MHKYRELKNLIKKNRTVLKHCSVYKILFNFTLISKFEESQIIQQKKYKSKLVDSLYALPLQYLENSLQHKMLKCLVLPR